MIRNRLFSLTVMGCLILAVMASMAGCSLDSGNPMAPTAGDSDGAMALDKAADHSGSSQAPVQALAKKVKEPKDKDGPAQYGNGSRK